MKQYIDKDALVAKIKRKLEFIEKRLERNNSYTEEGNIAWRRDKALYDNYNTILSIIDTLKVKEVDLEKSFNEYTKDIIACDVQFEPFTHLYNCAKYFFELGMTVSNKAQKGELTMKAVLFSKHNEVGRIDIKNLGELHCMANNPKAEDLIKIICSDGKTVYWCDCIEFIQED